VAGVPRRGGDSIQMAAWRDGILVPVIHRRGRRKEIAFRRKATSLFHFRYRIFSSNDANRCVKGKKLRFGGDSYHRQLFIGLRDILVGDAGNEELTATPHPEKVPFGALLTRRTKAVNNELKELGFDIVFDTPTCYGDDLKECKNSLNSFDFKHADAVYVSFMVHTFALEIEKLTEKYHLKGKESLHSLEFNKEAENLFLNDLGELFLDTKETKKIWGTGPAYQHNKVPYPYNVTTQDRATGTMLYNMKMLRGTAYPDHADIMEMPVIDNFHPTLRCTWRNCSEDGGHRNRFVNRIKAQLFLNAICKVEKISSRGTYVNFPTIDGTYDRPFF